MLLLLLINILLSVSFFLSIRSVLVRAYLSINYLVMLNPVLIWYLFDVSHHKFRPDNPTNETALIYVAVFNLVLCVSYIAYLHVVPRFRVIGKISFGYTINILKNIDRVVLCAVVIALAGYGSKFILDSIGAFKMLGVSTYDGHFLQIVRQLSIFDLFAIIFLAEIRLSIYKTRALLELALLLLLVISMAFAVWSGSRGQVLVIVLLGMIAYRDIIRNHLSMFVPVMLLAVPLIFYMFPLMSLYRGHGYDLNKAIDMVLIAELGSFEVGLDVLVSRFNYFEPLVRAIEYVEYNAAAGGSVYLNNFIGLVPRAVWPNKPSISNDSQMLAHHLGLVESDDTTTSVGLRAMGEAYYELSWLGVMIANIQAFLFVIIHKNTYWPGNVVLMTMYTYLILYILQRDAYFAVVPGLVLQIVGFVLFFGVIVLTLRWARFHCNCSTKY